jgi:acid phosphatase
MGWTEYPDGWGANGVTPAYQPSTVQSVHDGVLDFSLHNDLGASISPMPGGNRDQTYGAWSYCEKVDPALLTSPDFKQAPLLWPQSDANGTAAESDFPEGNYGAAPNAGQFSAFAHNSSTTQDAFQISSVIPGFDITQWHVYTQTWQPGQRCYYADGTQIGCSTSAVFSSPERWQLQMQPLQGQTGHGGAGHVYVNWAWIGAPSSTSSSTSTSSTTTTSTTTPTTTTTSTSTAPPPPGPIQHVVVIVMENHGASILSSMPYLSGLAKQFGSATNYYGIGHFSADNYIAMTSGTTCCFDDSFSNLSGTPNIFGQLGSAAQTLSESGGGGYAGRHDPQTYYGLPSSSGKFTDGQTVDLTGKKFTLVVPGLCNDMHDCGASTGDAWLSRNVPSFTANPNTAVFITFDEDSGGGQGLTSPPANNVPLVVVSPLTKGVTDGVQLNHYSLLRKIEDVFGLSHVGAAASAADMGSAFGF